MTGSSGRARSATLVPDGVRHVLPDGSSVLPKRDCGAIAAVVTSVLVDDLGRIVEHYDRVQEERRITEGLGELELERTREILLRHLPSPPGRVLDVGGGTGVHAAWLANVGYEVHLVDAVPRHVELARSELARVGVTAELGDARDLAQSDGAFDSTLLLGPLYHLTQRADRVSALVEAARVTRPGGVVVAAGISRFASLLDGLAHGFLVDDRFRKIVERDLQDGQHRNPTQRPDWFTTAFFHHPDQLKVEVEEAGLNVVSLVGIEGAAAWFPALAALWETRAGRDAILFAARATESEDSLRGLSPHLLVISKVPQS